MVKHSVEIGVDFSAGHRILGHAGKCRHLHGHSYKAVVTLFSRTLNALGMVVDFSDIKKFTKDWINEKWDHNMILNSEDPMYELLTRPSKDTDEYTGGKSPYCMKDNKNPTAESMARELYLVVQEFVQKHNDDQPNDSNYIYLEKVSIKEEEGSWASYSY